MVVEEAMAEKCPQGSRMGQPGTVSVMLEGPSTSVSVHASEPLPIRGKAFDLSAPEVGGGGEGRVGRRGSGLGARERDLGTGHTASPPQPQPLPLIPVGDLLLL